MSSELEELDTLISIATYPGIKQCLSSYRSKLSASASSPSSTQLPAAVPSLAREPVIAPRPPPNSGPAFTPISDFAWDQGEYNSPIVSVYIDLPGVGNVKDSVSCTFEKSSFDLTIVGLNGKNFRLYKDNLDKNIKPEDSKYIVKKDKIVVKLAKVKGEYSFENWTSLTSKKTKEAKEATTKDPMGNIMGMMKDMYDDGDENMKKIIGEAMMKAQRGEKSDPPGTGAM